MKIADSDAPEFKPSHPQITESTQVARVFPARANGRDVNKGSFGQVLVIAGSDGFAGASVLVAEAACRVGAGLVTLAVPQAIKATVTSRVSPVVMTRGLGQKNDETFGPLDVTAALALAETARVVALGPGIGQTEAVAAFVRELIARCPMPLVLDADALNFLAQEPDRGVAIIQVRRERSSNRQISTILTPHPGEMGRLLGTDAKSVQNDREAAARQACRAYGCVVLLKGERTVIASPDGTLYLNSTGNAGMATGGTGDALTGVIAGLMAQGLEPLAASFSGAYLHGLAGDLAAESVGGVAGLIATDLIAQLPRAIAICQKERFFATPDPS